MSNVVLFMSDEHNPRFSAPYGRGDVVTPNMQRLADRGTVFENAYCPSPLCMPSRSAFFSGRRTHEIQVYNNCSVNLKRDLPSYGQVLSEQGVHSVHIGKTHGYTTGDFLGFSEIHLFENAKSYLPGDTNIRRKPLAIRADGPDRGRGYGPRDPSLTHQQRDMDCVDRAVRWLLETAPRMDRPWVLVVQTLSPHFPHYCAPEYWNLYPGEGDLPDHGVEAETAGYPLAADLRRHFQTEGFTEEQVRGLRKGYRACISYVDHELGRVMEALEKSGQAASTDLVYTSDHGEMLGKFGMWWKCSLFEDSARVPIIAMGPDFAAGARVWTPVDLLDLQATLFHLTRAARPAEWAGEPLDRVAPADPERIVFSEYHGHGTRTSSYLVRQGEWKLIYAVDAPSLLFNLAEDPEELDNQLKRNLRKAKQLEEALRTFCDPAAEDLRAERFIEAQWEAIAHHHKGDELSE